MAKSLLLRLRLATVESEKEEMLHEVRQLRKMGQAGDLPRDLVSSLLLNPKKLIHFTESVVEKGLLTWHCRINSRKKPLHLSLMSLINILHFQVCSF